MTEKQFPGGQAKHGKCLVSFIVMDNCMPIEIRGLKLNLIGHWTIEELIVNYIRYKVCQTCLMLKTMTPEEV
jgi:hypothetical protein